VGPFLFKLNQIQMNPNKTISANSKGITITFGDVNKHKFVYYNNNDVVKKIQLHGTVKYQSIEEFGFNKIQKKLYAEAVYGLKAIPNEVLMEMRVEAIRKIQATHVKAKEVINNYKQEVSSKTIDNFLSKLFPKSPVIKQMINMKGIDPSIKVTMSLKDLKITPKMLAEKLVENNILPENFFKLA
jgi:hypothetical protein